MQEAGGGAYGVCKCWSRDVFTRSRHEDKGRWPEATASLLEAEEETSDMNTTVF